MSGRPGRQTALTRAPGRVRGAVGPGALRAARDREHRGRPLRHAGLQPPGRVLVPHLLQRQQAPTRRPAAQGARPAGWHPAGAHGLPVLQVQPGGDAGTPVPPRLPETRGGQAQGGVEEVGISLRSQGGAARFYVEFPSEICLSMSAPTGLLGQAPG